MKTVIERLKNHLKKCREHHNDAVWTNIQQRINIKAFNMDKDFAVLADFSAMVKLYTKSKDNSATNAHAVLEIYVVLHNRKYIYVVKEGEETKHSVNECDVFCLFGDTLSKVKKNDLVLQNAFPKEIV